MPDTSCLPAIQPTKKHSVSRCIVKAGTMRLHHLTFFRKKIKLFKSSFEIYAVRKEDAFRQKCNFRRKASSFLTLIISLFLKIRFLFLKNSESFCRLYPAFTMHTTPCFFVGCYSPNRIITRKKLVGDGDALISRFLWYLLAPKASFQHFVNL